LLSAQASAPYSNTDDTIDSKIRDISEGERLERIAGRIDIKAPLAAFIRDASSGSREQSAAKRTPRYLT